jgi:hypothetical protein
MYPINIKFPNICNVLSFFLSRAKVWAENVGQPCSIDSAKMLYKYFLCSKHFAESDFCTSERVRLNKVAVPHGSDSFSHSIPQPSESSYYNPSLNSLPTNLTPEDNLHVLPPTRTYGKASVSSTKTPMPVHADSPSTSHQIPGFQTRSPAGRTLAVKETSCSLSPVNPNACDGELRCISHQSSSSKPRARHSLLKEINLATVAELTPRKRKMYQHIRKQGSALCKLKKQCKAKKLKDVCALDKDPVMQKLASSLSVEAARY